MLGKEEGKKERQRSAARWMDMDSFTVVMGAPLEDLKREVGE